MDMFSLMFYSTHAIMISAICCILYCGLQDVTKPNIKRLNISSVSFFFTKRSFFLLSFKLTGFIINTLRLIIAILTAHYK
jgi:hypothetical protein